MILVVGCGPAGSAIYNALSKDNEVKQACDKEHPAPASGCITYDIKNSSDIANVVRQTVPEKLVLTEEVSSVEYCENNRLDAMEYNTRGVRFFVEAAAILRSKAIYLSSVYVFDGRKVGGLYTEYDHVNPINVYGETKLMGEVAVDKAADHLTLRMGEVYGNYPDNFVKHILDSLLYGQKLELARDMYFSPIYLDDVAQAVCLLAKENMSGLYDLAGPERISHYEMGIRIARVFGLKEDLLVPLSMEEMGFTVRMPKDLSMDISKLGALIKIKGIEEGLEAMKKAMASNK
jgi:dTDP-4-dehydrorhamnose reductase